MKKRGVRYWFRLVFGGLLGGILLLFFAYNALFLYFMTIPVSGGEFSGTPATLLGLNYQDVQLVSHDSTRLSGWYLPGSNTATIILLHGYGSNRGEMLSRAGLLNKAGFGTFLLDMRGHGKSGGTFRAFGWPDVVDVTAVLDWLQWKSGNASEPLGILGFSVGGQVALRATAQDPRLKAVIADDPAFVSPRDAPLEPSLRGRLQFWYLELFEKCLEWRTGMTAPSPLAEVIGRISCPLLLISSGGDLPRRSANRLYSLATGSKTLWEIPHSSHGTGILVHPKEYGNKIGTFFKMNLLFEGN